MRNTSGDDLAQLAEAYESLRLKDIARDSIKACEYCFIDPVTGLYWRLGEHHRAWHQLWRDAAHPNVAIEAWRGSGKSQTLMGLVCCALGEDPNLMVKFISCSDPMAETFVSQVATNIEHNERLRSLYPHLRPSDEEEQWTRHSITIQRTSGAAKDPSLDGRGVLASTQGGRAQILIFDDILDPKAVIMQPAIQSQIRYAFYNTWLPMQVPSRKSKKFVLFTPMARNDLYQEIKSSLAWFWNRWRAVHEDGSPVWPEKFDIQELQDRKDLSAAAYARNYMLELGETFMDIFPFEAVIGATNVAPAELLIGDRDYSVVTGIDPAHTARKHSSWSVIVTLAFLHDERRFILLDIKRGKWSPEVLCDHIIHTYDDRHPTTMLVENNQAQTLLLDLLRIKYPDRLLPISGYFTGSQKNSLGEGVPALGTEIRENKWTIPDWDGTKHDYKDEIHRDSCPKCALISELIEYPGNNYDCVMAMWLARKAAESYNSFVGVGGGVGPVVSRQVIAVRR